MGKMAEQIKRDMRRTIDDRKKMIDGCYWEIDRKRDQIAQLSEQINELNNSIALSKADIDEAKEVIMSLNRSDWKKAGYM